MSSMKNSKNKNFEQECDATITFLNKMHLDHAQIKSTFEKCGTVKHVRDYKDRVFIQFENYNEAMLAKNLFGKKYQITFARVKQDKKRDGYGDMRYHGRRFIKMSATGDKKENDTNNSISEPKSEPPLENSEKLTPNNSKMRNQEEKFLKRFSMLDFSKEKAAMNESHLKLTRTFKVGPIDWSGPDDNFRDLPPLIDAKFIPKKYSLILANLPNKYNLSDVYNLVEEVNPAYLTEIDCTDKKKIKFCEIYVNSEECVSYLSNKLDGFVICGKKLIAMELSRILGRPKLAL